jgi:hypothetical protein
VIAVSAVGIACSAYADWTIVEERYYTLTLAGKPCGRSFEVVERDGDRVQTRSRLEMRFKRLGEETVLDFANTFVETPAGDPVAASISMTARPRCDMNLNQALEQVLLRRKSRCCAARRVRCAKSTRVCG